MQPSSPPDRKFTDGLNPEQAQAVVYPSSCLAVVAGAGSGKTSVLTRRIAWLVKECGLLPESIMAVTFTNKAASEMRKRLEGLGIHGLSRMWLGTFHGLGARFLREYAEQSGLRPRFNILDASDSERLFKTLAATHGWVDKGLEVKEAVAWIAARKDDGKGPEDIVAKDAKEALYLSAYRIYQEECDRKGVVDFGELLLRPRKVLSANAALRDLFRSKFSHILVDEFQDTNEVQYEFVDLLSERGRCADVTVVGDMDQSIYSWRGAKMANLPRFVNEYGAKIVKLERNYRSTGHILAAANAVVENNRQRIPKEALDRAACWSCHPVLHFLKMAVEKLNGLPNPCQPVMAQKSGASWSDFCSALSCRRTLPSVWRMHSFAIVFRTRCMADYASLIVWKSRMPCLICGCWPIQRTKIHWNVPCLRRRAGLVLPSWIRLVRAP